MQQLNEAYQLTGLKDPLYNKLSEMFDDGAMYEERRMHESCAIQENQQLRTVGDLGPAHQFEDHAIHMEVHIRMLHEFRMRNPQDPRIPNIELHITMHKQMQQQEQFDAQMAMQGAASSFGKANASDPNAQPAATVEATQDAGMPSGVAGAPESQPSLEAADQSAQSAGL
jgi:hypothetical protein